MIKSLLQTACKFIKVSAQQVIDFLLVKELEAHYKMPKQHQDVTVCSNFIETTL
jgi:hypothetical protein